MYIPLQLSMLEQRPLMPFVFSGVSDWAIQMYVFYLHINV